MVTVNATVEGNAVTQTRTGFGSDMRLKPARLNAKRDAIDKLYAEYPDRKVTILSVHDERKPNAPLSKDAPCKVRKDRPDAGEVIMPKHKGREDE